MSKMFQVRLNKSRHEKLAFLYRLYGIKTTINADRFRELLDLIYSEKIDQSEASTTFRQDEQIQFLEGWDCSFRFPVWRYHAPTKEWHRKVLCFNPKTREIVKSNELDAEVCKRCHDTGGSAKTFELPEPKKPTPKSQPKKSKRQCVDCGLDISRLEEWKTRCMNCWRIEQVRKQKGDYDGKPLPGSPMDRGKQLGARTRRVDKTIKQSKEE